jgi:hypothetical protein
MLVKDTHKRERGLVDQISLDQKYVLALDWKFLLH